MKRRIALAAVLMTILAVTACTSGSTSTTSATEASTMARLTPTVSSVPTTVTSTTAVGVAAQVALRNDCVTCHADVHAEWAAGSHGNTQSAVALELAEERSGETPKDVIHGADAENCIACHGPTAVFVNSGLSEVNALSNFFTTTDGVFSEQTVAAHTRDWPSISCTTCHEVAVDHPVSSMPKTAEFDSTTVSYTPVAGSSELCGQCHGTLKFPDTDHVTYDHWKTSVHSSTQDDVAGELSEERVGETPEDVIHGDDAENCIACHGPSAVLTNGGMTEAAALGYFFTTDDGKFSDATVSDHASEWPSVGCVTCHDPHDPDHPALLDSSTGKHIAMPNSSELCGQCHGSLRFPTTDHLTYDAWLLSSHAVTQVDVAGELSEERVGETPEDVIHGDDAENCIACHGPTAVLENGGMSEAEALGYFFTTDGGQFSGKTVSDHASEWPDVNCTTCHDPHEPTKPALFESSSSEYVPMDDSSQLCGQCHGSLRFPDTDHLSYDVVSGTGGIGVPDSRTMPMTTCTSCHMYTSDVDGSNSSMQHGHSWDIFVPEEDGTSTSSCSQCHSSFSNAGAADKITAWQDSFDALHKVAAAKVASATDAMDGVDNADLQTKLDEAEHNLALAEGDESGGFHNHNYLMALLQDAQTRAEEVLAALG